MSARSKWERGLRARVFLLFAFGLACALPAPAQTAATPQASAGTPPAYEAVSIRPNKAESGSASMQTLPDGFRYINISLSSLIVDAYVETPGTKVVGLQDWANSDRYDIVARSTRIPR